MYTFIGTDPFRPLLMQQQLTATYFSHLELNGGIGDVNDGEFLAGVIGVLPLSGERWIKSNMRT
jgi:hypothetical protein